MPVCPGSRSFGGRCCLTGAARHVRLGAKQASEQTGNYEVDVQVLPVQTVAGAQDFHAGELIVSGGLKALGETRREAERTAIGQANDHSSMAAIVTYGGRSRLGLAGRLAAGQRSVDRGVSEIRYPTRSP